MLFLLFHGLKSQGKSVEVENTGADQRCFVAIFSSSEKKISAMYSADSPLKQRYFFTRKPKHQNAITSSVKVVMKMESHYLKTVFLLVVFYKLISKTETHSKKFKYSSDWAHACHIFEALQFLLLEEKNAKIWVFLILPRKKD